MTFVYFCTCAPTPQHTVNASHAAKSQFRRSLHTIPTHDCKFANTLQSGLQGGVKWDTMNLNWYSIKQTYLWQPLVTVIEMQYAQNKYSELWQIAKTWQVRRMQSVKISALWMAGLSEADACSLGNTSDCGDSVSYDTPMTVSWSALSTRRKNNR